MMSAYDMAVTSAKDVAVMTSPRTDVSKRNLARDVTVLATSSCDPTPVLGVHRIATYARFSMLKKLDFNLIPGFYGPTSRSSLGLKTLKKISQRRKYL